MDQSLIPRFDVSSSKRELPAAVQASRPAARLVLVITLLLIFGMAARTPLDTDMWWHLSAGEATLRAGRILSTDIFSFTRYGENWTNVQWLADAGMALLFRWKGYLALSAAVALLATLSMALTSLQCEGPVFLKSAALLLGSMVASVVWSPRPQLLSLVLMALVGYLLYLYKWRGLDRLWALSLIFVLWGNVHGGYPLGLILIGAMLGGEVLNHLLGYDTAEVLPWRKIARLAVWGLVCEAALLVNPFGFAVWQLPFQTVDMRVLQQFIPEWASPDFHQPLQQMFLLLFMLVVMAVTLSGRRMDATDLLTFLGFGMLAFLAQRNFGPFALAAVPLLVRYGTSALSAWQDRSPWLERIGRAFSQKDSVEVRQPVWKKAVNLLIVALLGLVVFGKLVVVSYPALVDRYITEGYPKDAAAWLKLHSAGGRILNEYHFGGYLQWELPGFPLFVDGRTDVFGDRVVSEWMTAVQAGPGWQEILDRYQVNLVMLEPDRPLLEELQTAGWKRLYQDAKVIIYGRN